jgi:hypothetical protein
MKRREGEGESSERHYILWGGRQKRIFSGFKVPFIPTADLTENTHRYYEIYSVFLPICTPATAIMASAFRIPIPNLLLLLHE